MNTEAVPSAARTPGRLRQSTLLTAADRAIVGAFLVTRLALVAAALLAETVVARNPNLTSGDSGPVLRSLTSWDGWWYLGIARDGYHAAALAGTYHDYAFLPLYPIVVRMLSLGIPGAMGFVSVTLSNVLFLAALVALARLAAPYLDAHRAALASTVLAVIPFGAVFGMAYAESLFLLLAVGAFLAVERGRFPLAGCLLALASLTRLQGVLLLAPLGLLAIERARGVRRPQAWLLLGPASAALFVGYVAVLGGSAGAFSGAQAAWGRAGVGAAAVSERLGASLSPQNIVSLVTLCVVLFIVLATWRRSAIPLAYRLVPVMFLGAAFASGVLESIGRYAVVAFPLTWSLAERMRTGRVATILVVLFGGLFFAGAVASFGGWLVP